MFLDSALQIFFLPHVREFLNGHKGDYCAQESRGDFAIPGELIRFLERMQQCTEPLMAKDFRAFVCENSSNPSIKAMKYGEQDSGEFLILMLEHLQYFSVHHLNLFKFFDELISKFDEISKKFFLSEIIGKSLRAFSDFGKIDQLSVDAFLHSISVKLVNVKLIFYIAHLKKAIQEKNLNLINHISSLVPTLIGALGQKDSNELLCNLNALFTIFTRKEAELLDVINQCLSAKRSWGNLTNRLARIKISEDNIDLIQLWIQCSFKKYESIEKNDVKEFFYNKMTSLDYAELDKSYLALDFDQFDQFVEKIEAILTVQKFQETILPACLENIKRVVSDLRNFIGVVIDGEWKLSVDILRSNNTFDVKKNTIGAATCQVGDLLSQKVDKGFLPQILIAVSHPFVNNPCTMTLKFYDCANVFVRDCFIECQIGEKLPFVLRPTPKIKIGQFVEYELIGMIYHKGDSSQSGHYIASGKYGENSWKIFDDMGYLCKKHVDSKTKQLVAEKSKPEEKAFAFYNHYITENDYAPQIMIYRRKSPVVAAAGDPAK